MKHVGMKNMRQSINCCEEEGEKNDPSNKAVCGPSLFVKADSAYSENNM